MLLLIFLGQHFAANYKDVSFYGIAPMDSLTKFSLHFKGNSGLNDHSFLAEIWSRLKIEPAASAWFLWRVSLMVVAMMSLRCLMVRTYFFPRRINDQKFASKVEKFPTVAFIQSFILSSVPSRLFYSLKFLFRNSVVFVFFPFLLFFFYSLSVKLRYNSLFKRHNVTQKHQVILCRDLNRTKYYI